MQLIEIGYLLSNRCRQRGAREPGLEIISRESPDTLTGQIHFSPVTYRQIYTLKKGAMNQNWHYNYFSKKVTA